jgi:prepilin-type N-terminal cleavage/methylation domain-containing protein
MYMLTQSTFFPERRRPRRGAHAFTLLEVMVGAVIAAIILAAIFAGISNSFAMITLSREDMRATQIIVSRMEGLHLEAWGNGTNQPSQLFNPTITPTNFTDYFYPDTSGGQTNRGVAYTGTLTLTTNVTLTPTTTYANAMALVTITVQWRDSSRNNQHNRSMTTYIAQNGMQNYIYNH